MLHTISAHLLLLPGRCSRRLASTSANYLALKASATLAVPRPPITVPVISLVPPPKKRLASQDSPSSTVTLDPYVFVQPIRRDILHLCVTHHMDSLRQGSANTKTRSEVAGSGRKIRPQKGSGRARLGDKKSPMLRGGGVAFGPKPRDFSTKLPRKVQQMGMRVALSAKLKDDLLTVVHDLDWPFPKTKLLNKRLKDLGWFNTLFVTGRSTVPVNFARASSNLQDVFVKPVVDVNIHELLKHPRVILDREAIEFLNTVLGKQSLMEEEDRSLTAPMSSC